MCSVLLTRMASAHLVRLGESSQPLSGRRSQGNEAIVKVLREYKNTVQMELCKICGTTLSLLDRNLIPSAQTGESKVPVVLAIFLAARTFGVWLRLYQGLCCTKILGLRAPLCTGLVPPSPSSLGIRLGQTSL